MTCSSPPDNFLAECHISGLLEELIELSDKWELMGVALGLPRHVISQCKHERLIMALSSILHEWISGNHKSCISPTLRNLQQILSGPIVAESRVASRLASHLKSSVSDTTKPQAVMVSKDGERLSKDQHLVKKYSQQREVPLTSWPPVSTNTYINLVLIQQSGEFSHDFDYSVRGDMDDITKSKKRASYSNLFEEYVEGALVLVEGRPGSGKTTFAHKLAKDWAIAEDILTNTSIVLLIPLRLLNSVESDHALHDLLKLLFWENSQLNDVESRLIASNGKGACFIFDGLDEYRQRSSKASVVNALIEKTFLVDAMVIITSRPVATAELKRFQAISKHVEIIGFSKDEIFQYVENYCTIHSSPNEQKTAENLKSYLNMHHNVLHMCYLPVNIAMICFLHQLCESIPHTETEIYEEFTKLTVLCSLSRAGYKVQLSSLRSLSGIQAEQFKKICHLAFDMCFQSRQMVYQHDTIVRLSPEVNDGDEWGLGLLTVDNTVAMFGFTSTYSFLHLTLQEFLAAYHMVGMKEDAQVLALEKFKTESFTGNIIAFFCGMSKFSEKDQRLKIVSSSRSKFQCAFESQQQVVCDGVVGRERKIELLLRYLSLNDITSLVYIISNLSFPLKHLTLKIIHFNLKQVRYFFEVLEKCVTFNSVSANQYWGSCVYNNLVSLKLDLRRLGCDGLEILISGLNDNNIILQSLSLRGCRVSGLGVMYLLQHLKCRELVQWLDLYATAIKRDELGIWKELKNWTSLKYLDVGLNNLDTSSLLDGITSSRIELVRLASCRLEQNHAYHLLELMKLNHILSLHLGSNKINFDGNIIESAVMFNLEELSVSYCYMPLPGIKSLIKILLLCGNLKKLNLSGNSLGLEGVSQLCSGLDHWPKLGSLIMDLCGVNSEAVHVLANGLKKSPSLLALHLSANRIDSITALFLCDMLQFNIEYLDLSDNDIDSETKTTIKARQGCKLRL